MEQYLPVLTLGVLGVLFVLLSIVAARLLAPERNTLAKRSPYECGITDQVAIPERFPVKFYLVAMLFIMFDIEIVFRSIYVTRNYGDKITTVLFPVCSTLNFYHSLCISICII